MFSALVQSVVLADEKEYSDLDSLVEVDSNNNQLLKNLEFLPEETSENFIYLNPNQNQEDSENNTEKNTSVKPKTDRFKNYTIYGADYIDDLKEETNETDSESEKVDSKLDQIKKSIDIYKQKLLQQFAAQKNEAQKQIETLKGNLAENYSDYEQTKEKINMLEQELPVLRDKMFSLNDQVKIIEDQIELSNLKLLLIDKQIEVKKNDLQALMEKLKVSNIALKEQKEKIGVYMVIMYEDIKKYYDFEEKKENIIKILVAQTTLADNERRKNYFNIYQKKGRELIERLNNAQANITNEISDIDQKRHDLNNLQNDQLILENHLEDQQQNKSVLMAQTKGEETKYKLLLGQYQQEQQEVQDEIDLIEEEIGNIQNKLVAYETLSKDEEVKLSNLQLLYSLDTENLNKFSNTGSFFLTWPVSPSGGITAYFHDPTYPFGVHQAIDIRQKQGSFIYAPAAGYVYRVKDNGMGYSYIILAHKENVLTVYGHVSEFLAKEGDMVQAGDVIGMSGGMPGTKGAGWMTTGPHLHFEVIKDGKHVDPLPYMPLDQLPAGYVPEKYKSLVGK